LELYLLSSNSLFWNKASIFVAPIGICKSKFLAYSIIAGNIMSNPIGETCFSSVAAAIFDSIKNRPAKRENIYLLDLNR
jgi:hypothetical protein